VFATPARARTEYDSAGSLAGDDGAAVGAADSNVAVQPGRGGADDRRSGAGGRPRAASASARLTRHASLCAAAAAAAAATRAHAAAAAALTRERRAADGHAPRGDLPVRDNARHRCRRVAVAPSQPPGVLARGASVNGKA
jgi:hypothetical protein